jgi:hypothetical protein
VPLDCLRGNIKTAEAKEKKQKLKGEQLLALFQRF